MKVLLIGSGGREHALAWKLAQSPSVEVVMVAPGNGGTATEPKCRNVETDIQDLDGLMALARRERIDLTVVGPEAPLVAGLVDRMGQAGLRAFGPSRAAAQLEGSKVYAKDLLREAGIPTASYAAFDDVHRAAAHVRARPLPMVIKADGLAAGKGVFIAQERGEAEGAVSEIMGVRKFGAAGARIVVEDFLEGEEASYLCFCDGERAIPMASSQDHKRVGDGDTGPNTGGMGAYSPAPVVTPEVERRVLDRVIDPTLSALKARGTPFVGVLYAGLMICGGMPRVLEFNTRFGDPECQPLMRRLRSDPIETMQSCIDGRLDRISLNWDPRPAVCVVMAAKGYPEAYATGREIIGLEAAAEVEGVKVFHAGTVRSGDRVLTHGGRVLGVSAVGDTLAQAIERAYAAVRKIAWDGAVFRRDIGARAVGR